MPVVASYTETALADYMHGELGVVATTLGYTVGASDPGSYQQAVNTALRLYGLSAGQTISDTTDMEKLEAVARYAAWSRAANDTSYEPRISADGQVVEYSGDTIRKRLSDARRDVQTHGVGYEVVMGTWVNQADPYRYLTTDQRTLP